MPGIQEIYGKITLDAARNRMIVDDVLRALEEGRSPILLTERKNHLEFLAEELRRVVRNLVILQGGMGKKRRRAAAEMLASIPDTEERVILATGRFVGEGFDDARLDTLFLTMPVAWRGTLVQYAGRLHPKTPWKDRRSHLRLRRPGGAYAPPHVREAPEGLPGHGL